MANITAAIVDDDEEVLDLIKQILKEEGVRTKRFLQAESLLDLAENHTFDIIISDLMLPGLTGLELLDQLQKKGINIPFVLITGYASLDSAIEAVNRGAFSYIKKPFNLDEIRIVISRLKQRRDLMEEIAHLRRQVDLLQAQLSKDPGQNIQNLSPQPMPAPLQNTTDLSKAFSAIEYLGRLKADGLITDHEFGEYKGKILKRII
jgi:DNA-binding NtrC family response regulator